MEAKDAVIKLNRGGILSDIEVNSYNNGAEAQAPVSFKAGEESVLLESKMGALTVGSLINKGRREVVEWIKKNRETPLGKDPYGYYVWEVALDAQCKEWGV